MAAYPIESTRYFTKSGARQYITQREAPFGGLEILGRHCGYGKYLVALCFSRAFHKT